MKKVGEISGTAPQSFKALKPKANNSFKALKPKAGINTIKVKAVQRTIKEKLGDTTERNDRFYYKCAWNLSESQIHSILERSVGKDSRIGYFLSAASAEMRSSDSQRNRQPYAV